MDDSAYYLKIEPAPVNHPLAAFLLREESPFQAFFADLGDHDWRAAETAYRRGDWGLMVERLGTMTKRKRIVYLKKDEPKEDETEKGEPKQDELKQSK